MIGARHKKFNEEEEFNPSTLLGGEMFSIVFRHFRIGRLASLKKGLPPPGSSNFNTMY